MPTRGAGVTAEGWREVERLFHQATQLASGERAAFVANIGDADVRAEVASLLAAEADRDSSIIGAAIGAAIGEAAQIALDDPLPGRVLAHFRIVKSIGRGGMGEVYLAQDLKLGRQVALKLLPAAFQRDAGRLRRFEHEARILAALNHPNIMTIYEVGYSSGRRFIAGEYVEGETLAERLRRGALPAEEAMRWAGQIVAALAAAHEKGVVHRDLKPANIKIKPDGVLKVLDFGLAKLTRPVLPAADPPMESPSAEGPENIPTLTLGGTRPGTVLGTAAYMSPEQARGIPVDRQADIWAFGAVLYEMLTGKRAFERATMGDTLAAVLKEEPDLTALAPRPRAVVRRCLTKDPRQRWQDIGDVRIALEEEFSGPVPVAQPKLRVPARVRWIAAAVACVAALGALGASLMLLRHQPRPLPQPLIRLNVDLGPEANLANDRGRHTLAISPDGTRIAFACEAPGGELRICTRRLDRNEAPALAGTEGVQTIFFSPDGKWIGFSANGKLKKVSVDGGSPFTLCDIPFDRGAAWGEDGFIVASVGSGMGLVRIPENGGPPRPLTQLKPGERTHRWPQILPGQQAVLFTAGTEAGNYENANLDVVSLQTGRRKTLRAGGYYGRYLPGGYLIYMHQGTLFAARMDIGRLTLTGPPAPVLEDVASRPGDGGADFDFSRSGTLVYESGKSRGLMTVQWLQPSGKLEPLLPAPGVYDALRLSPDGKRLALVVDSSAQGGNTDIWVYDLERGAMSRITFGGANESPVWSRDGKYLAYVSGQRGSIFRVRADGSGDVQTLTSGFYEGAPNSVSPDGRRLALELLNPDANNDIWTLPLEDDGAGHLKPGRPEPFLRTPASEEAPAFSPDGRWLAYESDESGSSQIYVRPFPAGASGEGGKWQISTQGGRSPIWSSNGRELFYTSGDRRIMTTSYAAKNGSFLAEKPVIWSGRQMIEDVPIRGYASSVVDLAPDGKRFAILVPASAEAPKPPTHVNVLLNFFDELRRRTGQAN